MAERNPVQGKISGTLNQEDVEDTQPLAPVKDGLKVLRDLEQKKKG